MIPTQRDIEMMRQRDLLAEVLAEGTLPLGAIERDSHLGTSAEAVRAVEDLIANDLLVLEADQVAATPPAIRLHELKPLRRRGD